MIRDRDRLAATAAHDLALECLAAGIAAADPARVVRDALEVRGDELRVRGHAYDLASHDRVVVLGGGNAAGRVASALEAVLGDRIDGGVVVTDNPTDTDRIEQIEGAHPVPDEGSVRGADRVLERAREAGEDTLVLGVITGGGSALMAAPAGDIDLAGLQATTDALLASGATIHEVNAVRKHVSRLKGGRLARAAAPATVVPLVFSDVVGDDLGVIASGPFAPDTTTYGDALAVLDRYDLAVPAAVREHLEAGAAGDHPESPSAGDPAVESIRHHVLASNRTALEAAREAAREREVDATILSSRIEGEAREAAKTHVGIAGECLATGDPVEPPTVLLSGGETTVTVRGGGEGGPNQEFVLSGALDLPDQVILAAVDTDGIDGATDAAGGIADPDTVDDHRRARAALDDNDAYTYFDDRGALIETGFTGTNVNDLRVLVIGVEE